MKKFKVSYSYPLEHPIKVVLNRLDKQGFVGWLFQKYGKNVVQQEIVITERIIELPTFHQWMGKIFTQPQGKILEIGHVASSTALELASLGFNVTAIDLRDYPFKHRNLTSLQGDFIAQEFSNKFDCIYSLSTIEHFGWSTRYGGADQIDNNLDEQAFEKISKLLSSEGRAIISVPYAKSWVEGIWFRVYTRENLHQKLDRYFQIEEERFYRRDKNEWVMVNNSSEDPTSPHDGVALFVLAKK